MKPVGESSRECPLSYPQQGRVEQYAEQWWRAFCQIVPECLGQAGISAEEVHCVAVGGSDALVPVDAEGNPLHPALMEGDRRAMGQAEQLRDALGERLFDTTGNCANWESMAARLLWFQQEQSQVYDKATCFLSSNGFLVYRLTGASSIDKSQCGSTLLYDLHRHNWSDMLIRELGIHKEKLPLVADCREAVGRVTPLASIASGLVAGTPVIAGVGRVAAGCLGVGCVHPGDTYLSSDTDLLVATVADGPVAWETLTLSHHGVPGQYLQSSSICCGKNGVEWLAELLREPDLDQLSKLAHEAPPGNGGLLFLPYMKGQSSPLYNEHTSGIIFGLRPEHQRRDLVRMFLEGSAYAVRYLIGIFREAGGSPQRIRLVGDAARSAVWAQIFSDVLDIVVEVPSPGNELMRGTAMVGAMALDWYASYAEAAESVSLAAIYRPHTASRDPYGRTFALYGRLLDSVLPVYKDANEIMR